LRLHLHQWYYFGARYYDPEIARWLSVDLLAGKYPSSSSYNYVLNNPIRLIDPDGQRVFVYSVPIGTKDVNVGKHLFIVAKNDSRSGLVYTSRGLYPKNRLLGVLTSVGVTAKTEVKVDLESEIGEVAKLDLGEESNATLEAEIEIPEGMTEEEFDDLVLDEADNYPTDKVDHNLFGPNSNTFVDDVIENAGGTLPDLDASGQNHGEEKDKKDD
jgi:RHS repeat-associated protein